jgi:hypothetical protein
MKRITFNAIRMNAFAKSWENHLLIYGIFILLTTPGLPGMDHMALYLNKIMVKLPDRGFSFFLAPKCLS